MVLAAVTPIFLILESHVRNVGYESSISIKTAILREKQLKKWNRAWKLALIEKNNPEWEDLYQKSLAKY